MTEANYTPENFDKMLNDLRVPLNTYYFTNQEKARLRFALALAQKVLGEPSEECERLGCEALLKWPWLNESMGNVELPPEPLLEAHKAMIQQAVKEVIDG